MYAQSRLRLAGASGFTKYIVQFSPPVWIFCASFSGTLKVFDFITGCKYFVVGLANDLLIQCCVL